MGGWVGGWVVACQVSTLIVSLCGSDQRFLFVFKGSVGASSMTGGNPCHEAEVKNECRHAPTWADLLLAPSSGSPCSVQIPSTYGNVFNFSVFRFPSKGGNGPATGRPQGLAILIYGNPGGLLPVDDSQSLFYTGPYDPQDCWKDMYASMQAATKLIYITGWSVWTALRSHLSHRQSTGGRYAFAIWHHCLVEGS